MNPNEYNDEGYAKSSMDLINAVRDLWEAGAEPQEIEEEFRGALNDLKADEGVL